ncbi:hypothetical protein PC9H_002163 [Pleurotus ostreatus]|uniref:Gpr1 family protein n=1 Tax=Pleurotus ostreatus TaxID=5322 RepID=A0A8H7DMU8_PLEOS|nr:uncharacterized protein PC9H_002163 [Pleurotus ostreatus]KAF7419572.1 hypothetical protein PC9H_002163 [Pleurotus ostreatus]KAJ8689582.1 hypothetical protein PTI98_012472 [Pleurotus ostreatus]
MSSTHTDIEKGHVAHHDHEKSAVHHRDNAPNGVSNSPAQAFPRPSTLSNPGPLGLFSFASTTFILSMFNISVRGIPAPNAVVGMAIFCGGLAQLLAGMWEFPRGNTFASTAFTSYGAFWMSYATILIPSSGIIAAYPDTESFENAIGIYLSAWMMVTFFFFIVALRKSVAFIVLFGFLTVTFALLAGGALGASTASHTGGGYMGIFTAFVAYYIGVSEMLTSEKKKIFTLPLGAF